MLPRPPSQSARGPIPVNIQNNRSCRQAKKISKRTMFSDAVGTGSCYFSPESEETPTRKTLALFSRGLVLPTGDTTGPECGDWFSQTGTFQSQTRDAATKRLAPSAFYLFSGGVILESCVFSPTIGEAQKCNGFRLTSSSRGPRVSQGDTTGPKRRGLVFFRTGTLQARYTNTAFDRSHEYSTDKMVMF